MRVGLEGIEDSTKPGRVHIGGTRER